MECISFADLLGHGSSWGTAGCSIQQPQHNHIQISDEVFASEGKDLEVCNNKKSILILLRLT